MALSTWSVKLRKPTGNRLTVAYISALVAIGLLISLEFGVQRVMLRDSEITQRVKDISASQRALVQAWLCKLKLAYSVNPQDKLQNARRFWTCYRVLIGRC